jgi:uncharacterized damage-inducible protein DinB
MTSHALLNALFGFNQEMNERLWTIIMEHLTDEQFVQSRGYSRGSIRNQLVHLANAQYYWLRALRIRPDLPELDAAAYPTRAAARAICRQADQDILDSVRGLSEADLDRIPDTWTQPVWVGLLQNANHGMDHRAQILRDLHDLGAPTFEQNFALYMESVNPLSVQEFAGYIGRKRAEWDELLRQVPARQMDQPLLDAWTVRDAIAIVTWKERRVVEIIRNRAVVELSFGELPAAEQASILEASRALPLPALLEQHEVTHHETLDALRALGDDALNAQGIDGLPAGEPFWKAIGAGTWWSYPAFSRPLRQLLQENAT